MINGILATNSSVFDGISKSVRCNFESVAQSHLVNLIGIPDICEEKLKLDPSIKLE